MKFHVLGRVCALTECDDSRNSRFDVYIHQLALPSGVAVVVLGVVVLLSKFYAIISFTSKL